MKTKQLGKRAEDIAARFLKRKGYKIQARNFNSRFGEIDIIAFDGEDDLVFIEVRYRGQGSYLLPEETLDYYKQKRLKCAALIYMNKFNLTDAPARFDLICVSKNSYGWFKPVKVQHIVDAF